MTWEKAENIPSDIIDEYERGEVTTVQEEADKRYGKTVYIQKVASNSCNEPKSKRAKIVAERSVRLQHQVNEASTRYRAINSINFIHDFGQQQ